LTGAALDRLIETKGLNEYDKLRGMFTDSCSLSTPIYGKTCFTAEHEAKKHIDEVVISEDYYGN
jgi:hypothetical protein